MTNYEETNYEEEIAAFVKTHNDRPKQRSVEWLNGKAETIGGSEVAALMGRNPYSSFDKVVGAKAGVNKWSGGSIACWWGTMFESAIEKYVEIDCGTRLAGTDISVPSPEDSGLAGLHANSPDGYAVMNYFLNTNNEWQILTTASEDQESAKGRPRKQMIALLEFKCPYRRRPKGEIPRHYEPQIWSGLALSPIAHIGVFVDAVFRKCEISVLGPMPGYDRSYHVERTNPSWTTPIAWGFTAVYAPRLDKPRECQASSDAPSDTAAALDDILADSTPNPAYTAWRMHCSIFGMMSYESPEECARNGKVFCPEPIDFGDCDKGTYETMMRYLNGGQFLSKHVGPCLADGRGARLRTSTEIGDAVDACAAQTPTYYYLLGIIPWKMFEVDYVHLERRPGFLDEVGPLIRECLRLAKQFRNSENPEGAYYSHLGEKQRAKGPKKGDIHASDVQALFDAI